MGRRHYFLIVFGFAVMRSCEANLVRKHLSSGEDDFGQGNAIYDDVMASTSKLSPSLVRFSKGMEISNDINDSTSNAFPSVVRNMNVLQHMEVDANGNIDISADGVGKAVWTLSSRVIELEADLNNRRFRIHELEAALADARAACTERGDMKVPHDLLEDASTSEQHDVKFESTRWAATQNHVKLYYAGDFDLLEADIFRNRRAQELAATVNPADQIETDAVESAGEKRDVEQPVGDKENNDEGEALREYDDEVDFDDNGSPWPNCDQFFKNVEIAGIVIRTESGVANSWHCCDRCANQFTGCKAVKYENKTCIYYDDSLQITAVNASECPNGAHRIESSNACANAALVLGPLYQFMGVSTFHNHPRGCSVDVDDKITFNLAPRGCRGQRTEGFGHRPSWCIVQV